MLPLAAWFLALKQGMKHRLGVKHRHTQRFNYIFKRAGSSSVVYCGNAVTVIMMSLARSIFGSPMTRAASDLGPLFASLNPKLFTRIHTYTHTHSHVVTLSRPHPAWHANAQTHTPHTCTHTGSRCGVLFVNDLDFQFHAPRALCSTGRFVTRSTYRG